MKSGSLGFVALSALSLFTSVGASVPPKPLYPKRDPSHTYGTFDVELDYEIHRGRPRYRWLALPFVEFKDIPYAKPPTGSRRWKAPDWPEVTGNLNDGGTSDILPQWQTGWVPLAIPFVAKFLGSNLTDPDLKNFKGPDDYGRDEDGNPTDGEPPAGTIDEGALTLDVIVHQNLWNNRNDDTKPKAKVLVWIYGGGYVYGHKNQHGNPDGFLDAAAKDGGEKIIYVALNYRLGAYGWLGGKKFKDQGGVPNVGLLDQRLALAWVKEYIVRFGGDPDNITVMGQSAGASSILHHITLSGGKENPPAFHQAILLSPGFFPQPNTTQDDDTFEEFLAAAGVETLSDLRSEDPAVAAKIFAANAVLSHNSSYGIFKFGPSVDDSEGSYVPDLPGRLLAANKFHPVPVLVGYTKLDGLLFTPPWIRSTENLTDHVKKLFPSIVDKEGVVDLLEADYPISGTTAKAQLTKAADFFDDLAIQCNAHYLTEALREHAPDLPVYRYVFNTPLPLHGADVDYYYHPETAILHHSPFSVREALADTMQTAVVNFVRSGAPGTIGDNDVEWPEYGTAEQILNLGNPTDPLNYYISVRDSLLNGTKCESWQSAPYWYGLESSGKTRSRVHLAKQQNYRDYQYDLRK